MTYFPLIPMLPTWASILTVLALVLLGSLRLTRLVTTDTLGGWLIREPLLNWAETSERTHRSAWQKTLERVGEDGTELDEVTANFILRKSEQLREGDEWLSWQGRLVSGITCPFCVGYWVGVLVLAATIVFSLPAIPQFITFGWLVLLGTLSLNYIVGHISARLD